MPNFLTPLFNFAINTVSYRFYVGQAPNVLIADLDILKQIMVKDFDSFTDHAVSWPSIPTVYYVISSQYAGL